MSVTSPQNLAARRLDQFEKARVSLSTLSALSAAIAFLVVAFLYLRSTTGAEPGFAGALLGPAVTLLVAMSGAGAVGAVVMRTLRDVAGIEAAS